MSVMTSREGAVISVTGALIPSMFEGDQETKKYNKKEALLKTRKADINPCVSAI
jgi:hypothetical protein